MFSNHSITATEAVCTAIVIATGLALATPLALTAGYFVVMFG